MGASTDQFSRTMTARRPQTSLEESNQVESNKNLVTLAHA